MNPLGMICPHCGGKTGFTPVEFQKYVRTSSSTTPAVVSGTVYDEQSNANVYGLARCQACLQAFPFRAQADNPQQPDISIRHFTLQPLWPNQHRPVADEIEPHTRAAFQDASIALGAGSVIGAMMAVRTAVIRASRDRKKALSLADGSLKSLADGGHISSTTFLASDVARRVANYLGHEEPDAAREYSSGNAEELY